MILSVWVRNEGITDGEFKDGDIFQAHPDTFVPEGNVLKRWLCVQTPDYGGSFDELVAPEYGVGPGNEAVIRRMRKYRLDYAPKLTPDELTAARDPNVSVPLITGRFTLNDIVRK